MKHLRPFLSKRKNGYWYIYYFDKYLKRQKLSAGTKKKLEALEYFQKVKDELGKNEYKKKKITLVQAMNQYVSDNKKLLSEDTLKNREYFFKMIIKECGEKKLVSEIQEGEFENIINKLKATVSKNTLREYQAKIITIINYLKQKEFVKENMRFKKERFKAERNLPKYFLKDDFDKIINELKNKDIIDIVRGAILTGLRRKELVNLKWSHIDLKNKVILFSNDSLQQKNRKAGSRVINDDAIELFKERAKNNEEFIFTQKGHKWNMIYLSELFRNAVRKVLGNDTKLSFHSLRHSTATNLLEKGVSLTSIKEILGHSNINTTMIYSHTKKERLLEDINKINLN